jgi:carboxyl-terminal processing protease
MSWKKAIIFIFVFFVFSSLSFYSGFYFGKSQCKICPPEDIDFSLFWEAYHKIQELFVDKSKIDPQKIIYGAISGMAKSLDDPYTVFFSQNETKRFEEDVKGVFEGIGIEIGIKNNQLQVIAPLEGTPAKKAGLKAGDKILKINDKFTQDLTLEEAVNLIRGPKGTSVRLTIFREGFKEPKEIEIVRDVIAIPSLDLRILEGGVFHLKIYQFSSRLIPDFKEAIKEIQKSTIKKIILDLRDNPGGYLDTAIEIAGWFLKKDDPVVIEKLADGREIVHNARGNSLLKDYKIIVLINGGTASASEILAGALRDNLKVMLIGEKSFGKGSVQQLVHLRDNSSLKITIAQWKTPKGKFLEREGLEPDVEVKMSEEDMEKERDPQLQKALEIISSL